MPRPRPAHALRRATCLARAACRPCPAGWHAAPVPLVPLFPPSLQASKQPVPCPCRPPPPETSKFAPQTPPPAPRAPCRQHAFPACRIALQACVWAGTCQCSAGTRPRRLWVRPNLVCLNAPPTHTHTHTYSRNHRPHPLTRFRLRHTQVGDALEAAFAEGVVQRSQVFITSKVRRALLQDADALAMMTKYQTGRTSSVCVGVRRRRWLDRAYDIRALRPVHTTPCCRRACPPPPAQ